jgi:hypothetical protein
MTKHLLALIVAGAAVAGCTSTGMRTSPTDVVRYHLSQPIAPGRVAVEPSGGSISPGPEEAMYSDAVARELARLGFQPTTAGAPADYVASVQFDRRLQGQVRTPPKFSIGIGGGSFGRNVGVGGGLSTGFGSKTRDVYSTELFVQLRRRSDGSVVWEGRAQRTGLSGSRPEDQPNATADRLASALFKGFPGESGITISVP